MKKIKKVYPFKTDNKISYIYESSDGGKTVYRRKIGDYHTMRELIVLGEPIFNN